MMRLRCVQNYNETDEDTCLYEYILANPLCKGLYALNQLIINQILHNFCFRNNFLLSNTALKYEIFD